MRLITISDTHNKHDQLRIPDGDIIVHAGDATMAGSENELRKFREWFVALPHPHKVFVAGNHDLGMKNPGERQKFTDVGVIQLHESGSDVCGLRFWGSPYSRFISQEWAFGHEDGVSTAFNRLPDDGSVEVLVTHGPPHRILDRCPGGNVGSTDLRDYVQTQVPLVHIFGHIHESYGVHYNGWVHFVNACSLNGRYKVANKPHVFDIDNGPEGFTLTMV